MPVMGMGLLKNILKENDVFFGGIKAIPIFALPKTSRVRLRARTPPFHGGDTGSNPVRGTRKFQRNNQRSQAEKSGIFVLGYIS